MSISIEDGDYNQVEVCDEPRKARKPHRCDACGETIAPGHRYYRDALLYDGSWQTAKRCARCQKIYEHLRKRTRAKRITNNGDVRAGVDWMLDCGHDYQEVFDCEPPPEIAALAFALPGEVEL